MQIIFSKEAAKELETRYTVLPLEPIDVNGEILEAFCIVAAEQLLNDLGTLELDKQLHQQLLVNIKEDKPELAQGICELLMGKFGGELDTFYEEIIKRIVTTGSCKLVINAVDIDAEPN